MEEDTEMSTSENKSFRSIEFNRLAKKRRGSFVSEYLFLLKNTKKYWMFPLLLIFLLFSALALFSSSAMAPFIYTLF